MGKFNEKSVSAFWLAKKSDQRCTSQSLMSVDYSLFYLRTRIGVFANMAAVMRSFNI